MYNCLPAENRLRDRQNVQFRPEFDQLTGIRPNFGFEVRNVLRLIYDEFNLFLIVVDWPEAFWNF